MNKTFLVSGGMLILLVSAFIVLAAPSASNVKVLPENPTAGDDIYCNYTYSSPIGENYTEQDSTYEWWKNNSNQNVNSQKLDKGNLTIGNEWFCKVTPSDGLSNGSQVQSSNNATIVNTVQNPKMYVNDTLFWSKTGYYSDLEFVVGFNDELETALGDCTADAEGYCNISLVFSSDDVGILNLTDLEIFYDVLIENMTVTDLTALYSNGTEKIFEFTILNNGDFASNNIYWSFDLGDGTVINTTINVSLQPNEDYFVYVEHDYGSEGDFTVNATVIVNNLTASINLGVSTGDLVVQNITLLTQNELDAVYEFFILNQGSDNISDINFSFDPGDSSGIIYAQQLINLTPDENARVYIEHNYVDYGSYTVTATANSTTGSDSESASFEIDAISVSALSVLNFTGTERVFEFFITNNLDTSLTAVNWTFDTDNSEVINSTQNTVLTPGENLFVYVQHDYGGAGTFKVNATAQNNTLIDWANLTFTIT